MQQKFFGDCEFDKQKIVPLVPLNVITSSTKYHKRIASQIVHDGNQIAVLKKN